MSSSCGHCFINSQYSMNSTQMILFSRNETFAKLFFIVSCTGLVTYVLLAFYSFHNALSYRTQKEEHQNTDKNIPNQNVNVERYHDDLKYILLWTISKNVPNPIGEGQQPFIRNNCSFINCFVTANKKILNRDYTNFNAIIFNMSLMENWRKSNLPQRRSCCQKYLFYSMLPSNDYPICNKDLDNYFNWTWSYKLYSDIVTPFIEVSDLKDKVIAPSIDVEWSMSESERIQENVARMQNKTKAVAIVISDCKPHMTRMSFSKELQYFLKEHNLVMDIYGCGGTKCPKRTCFKNIREYFFYLVYEDSFSEDYLTREVLNAYENNAVPILKSGADYTKFLPPGSYIDATATYPEKLAAIIEYIIQNPATYDNYHSWRKNYSITEVNVNRGLCKLCELLNNDKRVRIHSSYETFRKWWYYDSLRDRCYPKGAENYSEVFSYINKEKNRTNISDLDSLAKPNN